MRGQVLTNLKRVNQDGVPAGTWVYQPAYPRVLDKLNELLGHFQNDNIRMIQKKRQGSVTSSSSGGSEGPLEKLAGSAVLVTSRISQK